MEEQREFTNGFDTAHVRPCKGGDGWELLLNGTPQPSIDLSYQDAVDAAERILTEPVSRPLLTEEERVLHTGEDGFTSAIVKLETKNLLAYRAKAIYSLAKSILNPGGDINEFTFDVIGGDDRMSLIRFSAIPKPAAPAAAETTPAAKSSEEEQCHDQNLWATDKEIPGRE